MDIVKDIDFSYSRLLEGWRQEKDNKLKLKLTFGKHTEKCIKSGHTYFVTQKPSRSLLI